MKKCLEFGKNALIKFIYGLNFQFKMLFEEYLGQKYLKCFPVEPLFHVLQTKRLLIKPRLDLFPEFSLTFSDYQDMLKKKVFLLNFITVK